MIPSLRKFLSHRTIEITEKHTLNEHTKKELETYCFKIMTTIQSIHISMLYILIKRIRH